MNLIVWVVNCWLFLLQIVRLLEQIKRDDLYHVYHSVAATDLLQLVKIVQYRVLGLIHFEDM